MFKPDFYFNNTIDITADFLKQQGIEGLLLDVDNTMAIFHTKVPVEGISDWIKSLQNNGIKLRILSNAKHDRIKVFASEVDLPFFALSLKPLPFRISKAAKLLDLSKKQVAVVGDQMFTDILGGNLAGLTTIMVKPIKQETEFSFIIKRKLEKIFLKNIKAVK